MAEALGWAPKPKKDGSTAKTTDLFANSCDEVERREGQRDPAREEPDSGGPGPQDHTLRHSFLVTARPCLQVLRMASAMFRYSAER